MAVKLNLDPGDAQTRFDIQPEPTSPIEKAKNLAKCYTHNQLSEANSIVPAKSIVGELKTLCSTDLYPAMEGLCYLLILADEDFQLTLLKEIKIIFHSNFSTKNLNDSTYLKIFELEEVINGIIKGHIQYYLSLKVLYGLIDLFQDILEHLWLMPHLQSNSALIPIKERFGKQIESHILEGWEPLMRLNLNRYAIFRTSTEEALRLARMAASPSDNEVIHFIQSNLDHFHPPDNLSYIILGTLGDLYFEGAILTRAIKYYREALAYLETQPQLTFFKNPIRFRIETLNKLGMAFAVLEDYDAALACCKESLDYTDSLSAEEKLAVTVMINGNFGRIYSQQKNYTEALPYFLQQFGNLVQLDNPDALIAVCRNLEETYSALKQPDKAQKYRDKCTELTTIQARSNPPQLPLSSVLDKIKAFLGRGQAEQQDASQGHAALKECVTLAKSVIPELRSLSESNLDQAREGFCLLLQLDDDSLRQTALLNVRPLFHCNFSINTDQEGYQRLIDLEASVSETIDSHIRSNRSHSVLISLLELHQSILEQLLYLPYFIENDIHLFSLIEKNTHLIQQRAELWMKACEQDEELENILITTKQILAKLAVPLSQAVQELCVSFQAAKS